MKQNVKLLKLEWGFMFKQGIKTFDSRGPKDHVSSSFFQNPTIFFSRQPTSVQHSGYNLISSFSS